MLTTTHRKNYSDNSHGDVESNKLSEANKHYDYEKEGKYTKDFAEDL